MNSYRPRGTNKERLDLRSRRPPIRRKVFKYGPNSSAVEALIEKIGTVTPEQIRALAVISNGEGSDSRDAARTRAWNHVLNAGRSAAWDSARSDVWNRALTHSGVQRSTVSDPMAHAARLCSDAAVALVAKDLIPQETFDDLYAPWASVMEAKR